MRVFEDMNFHRDTFADRSTAAIYASMDLRRCYFESYFLSLTNNPAMRSTIQDVRMSECSQRGCTVYTAIIEDVLVDGLKTNGQLLRSHGAVFKHVILRGKIDRLMLSNDALPASIKPDAAKKAEIATFRQANAEYYRNVDWALDISQGEFVELELRDIPGHLIRRDPDTQVLIKRERVLQDKWRDLDFKLPITPFVLGQMLQYGMHDRVLIAPKRDPKFRDYLYDLRLLQTAGIAEPD